MIIPTLASGGPIPTRTAFPPLLVAPRQRLMADSEPEQSTLT